MSDDELLRFVSGACIEADDCLHPECCTCYLQVTPEFEAELRKKAAQPQEDT